MMARPTADRSLNYFYDHNLAMKETIFEDELRFEVILVMK